MTPLAEVACNLCGANDVDVVFESPRGAAVDSHYAATTDVFGEYGRVVRCRACGLVYTSPRLAPAELLAAYSGSSDETYVSEADARSMNAYLSLSTLRRHAPRGKLLEVGCSAGYFLNAARVGYEVVGVEPSSWARKLAVEGLKLDVPAATLKEANFPAASFDAAAAIDVIEHVPDPKALVGELARVVKPGGVLYLVTPDIDSLSARLLGKRWWGLRPAHIYYFSKATLARLLEDRGFEVVEARSYGRIFTWGYWLSRLSNYPRPVYRAVERLVDALDIRGKFLYLDTRDSMQVVARRK